MKVNFNVPFKNYKGESTKDVISDKIAEALFNAGTQGNQISNENKYNAYKVSTRISQTAGEVEITTEEATLIKEVCANYLVAGGYGQVHELIEEGGDK